MGSPAFSGGKISQEDQDPHKEYQKNENKKRKQRKSNK